MGFSLSSQRISSHLYPWKSKTRETVLYQSQSELVVVHCLLHCWLQMVPQKLTMRRWAHLKGSLPNTLNFLLQLLWLPVCLLFFQTLGTAACPPYHLAVVIGGTSAEFNLKTVKLASCRYLDGLPDTGEKMVYPLSDRTGLCFTFCVF